MPLSTEGAAINADLVANILTHRATIYTRASGTGLFTVEAKTALACRLEPVGRQTAATTADRADLANLGSFRYDATYSLPETAYQIAVDAYPGMRWNPMAGTAWPDDLPGIGVISKTIDVARVKV